MRHAGSPTPPPLILSLPGFEGTLDELLTLVRSGVFCVVSLPLSRIASAVLGWVCKLESQAKIESADAVEVAAALIRMKSRSLLPAPPPESPAAAGATESAALLEDLEALRTTIQRLREMWRPARFSTLESLFLVPDPPETAQKEPETVHNLIRMLEHALHLTRNAPPPLCFDREPNSLQEMAQLILDCCAEPHAQNRGYVLNDLLASHPAAAPALFLAALELVRNEQVTVHQPELFGAIQLQSSDRS